MISSIILSAGLSSRFGSPKALVHWENQTIIERLQNLLISSEVDEIIVVLGAEAELIKPCILKHKKVKFFYNKDYLKGQTSSLKVGLREISECSKGFLLVPVDFPLINSSTIMHIIDAFHGEGEKIILPTYKGRKGHPPLFPFRLKDEFLSLNNDKGLNSIASVHEDMLQLLPLEDKGIIQTFNTQEEFNIIKNRPNII